MIRTIVVTLAIILFIAPDIIYACSTCFGDPNAKATQGMNLAIITMLTITGGVLSSFVSFIYVLNKRAKDYAKTISKRKKKI
jgi:heme/copper-type cytochrome/quinol oxidase subunit 2